MKEVLQHIFSILTSNSTTFAVTGYAGVYYIYGFQDYPIPKKVLIDCDLANVKLTLDYTNFGTTMINNDGDLILYPAGVADSQIVFRNRLVKANKAVYIQEWNACTYTLEYVIQEAIKDYRNTMDTDNIWTIFSLLPEYYTRCTELPQDIASFILNTYQLASTLFLDRAQDTLYVFNDTLSKYPDGYVSETEDFIVYIFNNLDNYPELYVALCGYSSLYYVWQHRFAPEPVILSFDTYPEMFYNYLTEIMPDNCEIKSFDSTKIIIEINKSYTLTLYVRDYGTQSQSTVTNCYGIEGYNMEQSIYQCEQEWVSKLNDTLLIALISLRFDDNADKDDKSYERLESFMKDYKRTIVDRFNSNDFYLPALYEELNSYYRS